MSAKRQVESKWMFAVTPEIRSALRERATDGTITCEVARKLAEELDVAYPIIGAAANLSDIRITTCSLGCF